MTNLQNWSQTADNNATADSNINWREGQAPSTVNNSARAMMAAIACWRDDTSGKLVDAGSGGASNYVLTSNQGLGSTLINGFKVSFQVATTNASPVTLEVDNTGNTPLRVASGVEVPAGYMTAGGVFTATYFANTNEWILDGYFAVPANVIPTGTVQDYLGSSAPSGWVLANGGTIGSSGSGATALAGSSTQNLYSLLWNISSLTVSGGGRGSTAAADFAANKTITLPDLRSRVTLGLDNMGGTAANIISGATSVGVTGGEATHTLTNSEMPSHTHTASVTDPGHNHIVPNVGYNGFNCNGSGSQFANQNASTTTSTATTGISVSIGNTGSGGSHNNLQPYFALNKIIKL
jgi:microcystin-dependent protein